MTLLSAVNQAAVDAHLQQLNDCISIYTQQVVTSTTTTTTRTASTGYEQHHHQRRRDNHHSSHQTTLSLSRGEAALLAKLKDMVPIMPRGRELSQLEIINHVIEYIRHLRQLIELDDEMHDERDHE